MNDNQPKTRLRLIGVDSLQNVLHYNNIAPFNAQCYSYLLYYLQVKPAKCVCG